MFRLTGAEHCVDTAALGEQGHASAPERHGRRKTF